MKNKDDTKSPEQIVEGLQQLMAFITRYAPFRDQDQRKVMTFRQAQAVIHEVAKQHGVLSADVAPFREHPEVQEWELEVSMEMDEMGLVEQEHLLDLPLNFRFMPEYEPLLQAEDDWIQANGGYLYEKDFPQIIEALKPYLPSKQSSKD